MNNYGSRNPVIGNGPGAPGQVRDPSRGGYPSRPPMGSMPSAPASQTGQQPGTPKGLSGRLPYPNDPTGNGSPFWGGYPNDPTGNGTPYWGTPPPPPRSTAIGSGKMPYRRF